MAQSVNVNALGGRVVALCQLSGTRCELARRTGIGSDLARASLQGGALQRIKSGALLTLLRLPKKQ